MNGCLHIDQVLDSNLLILQECPGIQQRSKLLIVRVLGEGVSFSDGPDAEPRSAFLPNLISWQTITTLWMAWLIYWIVSAWGVRRNERGESGTQRFLTALVLGFGGFLIFARASHLSALERRFLPDSEGIQVAALIMVVGGLGFSVWARRHIGQFWSSRVTLKEGHQLIQSGPYARVRHPIYSGIALAMIGTALFVGEWRALLGAAIFIVGHWLKGRREEALLTSQFGPAYEEYKNRTGSLLPRLR
jgi:protein-S-isoprenylcysteine O-methyltransferase Ste14